MPKRKKYIKKPYESDGSSSDVSSNIYASMMLSSAWLDLTATQKALYCACKLEQYRLKNHPNGDISMFYMNKYLWSEKYKLYDANNGRGFQRDIKELIKHGFIRCVACGATTREKSIYQYSTMWKKYGTAEFKIDFSEMTSALARDERAKQAAG